MSFEAPVKCDQLRPVLMRLTAPLLTPCLAAIFIGDKAPALKSVTIANTVASVIDALPLATPRGCHSLRHVLSFSSVEMRSGSSIITPLDRLKV